MTPCPVVPIVIFRHFYSYPLSIGDWWPFPSGSGYVASAYFCTFLGADLLPFIQLWYLVCLRRGYDLLHSYLLMYDKLSSRARLLAASVNTLFFRNSDICAANPSARE
jgi:hypothetical protein